MGRKRLPRSRLISRVSDTKRRCGCRYLSFSLFISLLVFLIYLFNSFFFLYLGRWRRYRWRHRQPAFLFPAGGSTLKYILNKIFLFFFQPLISVREVQILVRAPLAKLLLGEDPNRSRFPFLSPRIILCYVGWLVTGEKLTGQRIISQGYGHLIPPETEPASPPSQSADCSGGPTWARKIYLTNHHTGGSVSETEIVKEKCLSAPAVGAHAIYCSASCQRLKLMVQ